MSSPLRNRLNQGNPYQTSAVREVQSQASQAAHEAGAGDVYPWRRFFARVIDNFVYGTAFSVIAVPVVFLAVALDSTGFFSFLTFLVMMVLFVPFSLGGEAWLTAAWGTTPGKRVLGLWVTDSQGQRLTMGASTMRMLKIFGFGILVNLLNILGLGLFIWQYLALTNDGYTWWDAGEGIRVSLVPPVD